MHDIENTVTSEDVIWTMDWDEWPNSKKHGTEERFEPTLALAHLLINEVVFINRLHWRDDVPEDVKQNITVFVNCNDVFAWGCADSEDLPLHELENLYRMWLKDPAWGSAVWCMQKRSWMPQKPVEKRIRAAGIWDLDRMNLEPNGTN